MACTALRLLEDKIDAGVSDRLAHMVGLVTDDCVHILGGHNLRRRRDYMGEQRLSPHFMQHFRMFGLEACALTGGHDGDGNARRSRLTARKGMILGGKHWTPIYRDLGRENIPVKIADSCASLCRLQCTQGLKVVWR